MHALILTIALTTTALWLTAQDSYTLSGYLRDAANGEELLYASVAKEGTAIGVTTNLYGYYSLTLPAGTHEITYSYVGYETVTRTIELTEDLTLDVELSEGSVALTEVVVTAEAEDENITSTEVSVNTIDMKQAKVIPVLMGEQDVIKTIQLLPGVSAGGEASAGFFVRGGDADQNLILLDEAPVYNASHLLGFFSVFNSDALKDVKLYKGGMPAQYGGRVSSVLDVRMKNGNAKEWEFSGGLGLISSRLTVEGPIEKDKGSIIVSGRRTYLDILAGAVSEDFQDVNLYFYDINAKANYRFGDKDRVYLSYYNGRDAFGSDEFGFDWGNQTTTLRWNHVYNSKLFSNTTAVYSDYDYGFALSSGDNDIDVDAGIFSYLLRQDFDYYLNPRVQLQFGAQGMYYRFKPSVFSFGQQPTDASEEQQALEGAVYAQVQQKVGDKLSMSYGLRASGFGRMGEYTERTYDTEGVPLTETTYESGELYSGYFNLLPRFNATYVLDGQSSVKMAYNRNAQYIHLLSNSNSGNPTDLWIPSSPAVAPTTADQIAAGYFRNFNQNRYKASVEVYYKSLDNTVDYIDGAETNTADIEAELTFGQGRAYGIEFLVEKTKGKLTGWASYTLSRSERQYDDINGGDWFSATQDRTHDLSLVAAYQLNRKITLSSSWVYSTGNAVTFPTGKYYVDGALVNLYSERNAERMPDYHRLDLGMTWVLRDDDRFYNDLNFSIYNAYNRLNTFTITFDESETNPGTTEATRTALFGAVPSVTWNFRF